MSTTAAVPTTASAPGPAPAAANPLWLVVKALASLQLTVALFVFAVGLVFLGTLAQKSVGIWSTVEQYFWSWVVVVDGQYLAEFGKVFFGLSPDLKVGSWVRFPFPGGKLIGGLMFVNLLAAHALRFKLTWKRSGIFILHGGLLLLFVGEFITREFQIEQQMRIPEGESTNYAIDTRNYELAFLRRLDDQTDRVTVVPARQLRDALKAGSRVSHPELPVDIEVVNYMPNSDLVGPADPRVKENPATAGDGVRGVAIPLPEVSGVDMENRDDYPSAYVRLFKKGTNEELGTYLVTRMLPTPQPVKIGDDEYGIALRNTRYYKPFTIHLVDFRFDRYVGTDTPKNYSSDILLTDPEKGQIDRAVTIRMNEPFRHRGETFYQQSFTPDEKSTILQVVRNPGWVLPYVSCVMVTLGMLIHFGIGILGFLKRSLGSRAVKYPTPSGQQANSPLPPREPWSPTKLILPVAVVAVAGLYVLGAAWPKGTGGKMDLREVARLPVVDGGRVKPLDTVARVDLRLISHREEFEDADGKLHPAIKWFMESATRDPIELKVFRIESDQVRDLFKLPLREGLRYSIKEMQPRYLAFLMAVREAEKVPAKQRDLFQAKVLELSRHIQTYLRIAHGRSPLVLPQNNDRGWASPADLGETAALRELAQKHDIFLTSLAELRAKLETIADPQQQELSIREFDNLVAEGRAKASQQDAALGAWDAILSAYRSGDASKFNEAVAKFRETTAGNVGVGDMARVRFEAFLNDSALFYHCTVMYVLAILAGLGAWVGLVANPPVGQAIRRATFWWLAATFAVHTFTLLSRMYLMDRPLVFVTNLYSSAVFIGWGVVGVCLIVERLYPIGVGNFVGAVLGFATSIVAHNLATSGDTLEMMQAVLDTNFWLATHVTTISMGYAATFIAGTVGLVYIVLYVLRPEAALKKTVTIGGPGAKPMELGRALGQIIYGIVCFATLLSFVGTVLGGIWADQSWGRFWGWDPKENGAVLIVLWNALILHARWCGLVKDRGMAILAVIGNMITTWSWFGTNQLGVGLHAYGFNNQLVRLCVSLWVVHLIAVLFGLVPWARVWQTPPPAQPVRQPRPARA